MFRALAAPLSALTTPLLPEDYLALANPLWSTELRGRVVAVRRETTRATTLTIRPGRGWAGHRPGQYVRVGVDVDGVRHWRTYSLTGLPGERDLRITVQALDGGRVSGELAHRTPPGTILRLEAAAGDFVLSPAPGGLLFVTAGTGITPVMSMVRALAARGALARATLVHSARTPADTIFGDELVAYARAGLTVHVRHTATAGRLDLAELHRLVPDHRDRDVYVCGPEGLLDAATAVWDARRLHLERFTPPARSAGGTGGSVRFGGTEVQVGPAASLLEAGEAAGLLLPSGCRMGICHGCVLPLRDGQVRDLRTGEVHGEPGDLVQTCVSGASGAARIDVPTRKDHR
ncbi:MAG: ferredoxin reductase [Pseudonocardia sp.]